MTWYTLQTLKESGAGWIVLTCMYESIRSGVRNCTDGTQTDRLVVDLVWHDLTEVTNTGMVHTLAQKVSNIENRYTPWKNNHQCSE